MEDIVHMEGVEEEGEQKIVPLKTEVILENGGEYLYQKEKNIVMIG